jgi:hypothetical protein
MVDDELVLWLADSWYVIVWMVDGNQVNSVGLYRSYLNSMNGVRLCNSDTEVQLIYFCPHFLVLI